MRLFFLSDLHLSTASCRKAQALVDFLQKTPQRGDTVVLGGDVFDLFVGARRVFLRKFSLILNAMKEAESRGVVLYYLEGNHDFHLSRVFRHHPNIVVKAREIELRLHGRRIYICHGDEIDREDRGYLLLRAATRSRLFVAATSALPDWVYAAVGSWSSRTSRKYTDRKRADGARSDRLRDLFRSYAAAKVEQGASLVLIGHSHVPDRVDFRFEGRAPGTYVNLGYSEDDLLLAEYDTASDRAEVKSYRAEAAI
ncbi:MAG: UDP-2,3-diacylglucosamine diphosphatase [Bdellovibrionales bacterium]|nr:UDP-2,3-diacylglucosamine diphosphatase [Bdellovibrionales bacterium]